MNVLYLCVVYIVTKKAHKTYNINNLTTQQAKLLYLARACKRYDIMLTHENISQEKSKLLLFLPGLIEMLQYFIYKRIRSIYVNNTEILIDRDRMLLLKIFSYIVKITKHAEKTAYGYMVRTGYTENSFLIGDSITEISG